MGSWKRLFEGFLAETTAYRGEGRVKYQDLVKLFDYLSGKPKGDIKTWDPRDKSGKPAAAPKSKISVSGPPAKEGGFADVTDFQVVPKIWNRWFTDLDGAISYATSTDSPHQQRQAFIPTTGYGGRKGWAVSTKEIEPEPRSSAGDIGPARPTDLYDFAVVADLENIPLGKGMTDISTVGRENKPSVTVKRIAWVPAVGDSQERARKLKDFLGGKGPAPIVRPQRKEPSLQRHTPDQNAGQALMKKGPTLHAPAQEPLPGNAPRKGLTKAAIPAAGTPERTAWERDRAEAQRDLGIPAGMSFKDWLKMRSAKEG